MADEDAAGQGGQNGEQGASDGGSGESLLDGVGGGAGGQNDGAAGDGAGAGEGDNEDWFLAEGVKGSGDRPDWFMADKYKSVEEQARAYPELAKKLGGFTGAPEGEYEVTMPEGVKGEILPDDPMITTFKELARESNMSQETFTKILHGYITGEEQSINTSRAKEMEALGDNAEARVTAVAEYAKANLSDDHFQSVRRMAVSAENIEALEALIQSGREGNLASRDTNSNNGGITKEELEAMQHAKNDSGQRLMEVDPAYRKKVRKAMKDFYGTAPKQEIVGQKE